MSREALVVIDAQNDFVLPGRPLTVNGAAACLPKVVEAVNVARHHGVPVFFVIREHHPSGIDIEHTRSHLFKKGGAGATVAGTEGARLVDALKPLDTEFVVIKKRFSAFFQTSLDMMLRRCRVDRVVLCGFQTPNCIRASAFDAVSLDYPEVVVLEDATASASKEVQDSNIRDIRNIGVGVSTVEAWKKTFVTE